MSRVICNSGPLIALGVLARLDILKFLFDEVLVPEAVQKEIERGGIRLSGLEDFRRADWIRIVPLKEKRDELLQSLLDIVEATVISGKKGSIIDDFVARAPCPETARGS